MIDITCIITNPFTDTSCCTWKPIKYWTKKLTTHIAYELSIFKNDIIVGMHLSVRPKGDHKGISMLIALFGYHVELGVYDIRHEKTEEYA